MKKLLPTLLLIGLGTYFFYHHLFVPAISRLTLSNGWPLPPLILSLFWIFLVLIIIDLIYMKHYSLFAVPAVYFAGFFTGNDALWASELLWNKNIVLIAFILFIYASALLVVIYRVDPNFLWISKGSGAKEKAMPPASWRSLSIWNKTVAVIGLGALTIFGLYVPYNVILTCGYLINQTEKVKQAKVLGVGQIHGKNFFHRYWDIELDGKPQKFWVYAAANTEPVEKHTCSTNPDPEVGSTIVITGREGVFGFSYDRVVRILDAKGNVICD